MIVSSVIAWADLQSDGRKSVREVWTDDKGNVFNYDYMADVGIDPNTIMANRTTAVQAESDELQAEQAAQVSS